MRRVTAALATADDDFAGLHELAAGDFVIALPASGEKLLFDSPRLLVAAADAVGLWARLAAAAMPALWRGWRRDGRRRRRGFGSAVSAMRADCFPSTSTRPSSVHDQAAGGLERGDAAAPTPISRAKSACDMVLIAPSSSLRPTLRVLAVEFFTRDAPRNAVKIETPLIVRHANKDHHRLNSAAPCAEVEALINAR